MGLKLPFLISFTMRVTSSTKVVLNLFKNEYPDWDEVLKLMQA